MLSLRLRHLSALTLPDGAARRTVLQKVRGRSLSLLPQLEDTGFQVLFHSPPGVLFTFPSQYCALSVTEEYSALRGGPRSFLQDFSCPAVLRILPCPLLFRVRGFHPLRQAFPCLSPAFADHMRQSVPRHMIMTVWAPPGSLAATSGITFVFFSSGYLDVSVHRVPPASL